MNSFLMIIFGATGDLTQSKLLPSLFNLYKEEKIPRDFYIVGFARRPFTDDEFRSRFNFDQDFLKNLYYQQGDFDDLEKYNKLIERCKIFEKKGLKLEKLLYLATPPKYYESIIDNLKKSGLSHEKDTKVVVEKPFGKDIKTAKELDKMLSDTFEEKQIFRVDHYLGKETVQNILAFRFANGIFEPVWNKDYLDHVQITFAEKNGVEKRGAFFDGIGELRDVGQNHLMQLIAAVAMEQPKSFSREGIRDERAKVMKALQCVEKEDMPSSVVRGQYKDYLSEEKVSQDSKTETFAAFKFFINTLKFQNIPFYVRAGKKMPKNTVEISLVFIQTCHILFKEYGCPEIGNVLTIRIQPDEGISIRMIAKKPGTKLSLGTVDMHFTYQEAFNTRGTDAYEKILLDIFDGDQMLFNRSDELSSSWEFISKILNEWKESGLELRAYEPGTWGPKEAEDLIKKDGRKWL